ncbi:MAG: hypothetical protein M1823_004941 [Watsoniomyces obsoletus]|nr:MAG: hypothetical protein M1823_004941 [Watsoniomyces obsoletus]
MDSNHQPAKRTKFSNMDEEILNEIYPAKVHAKKVVEYLRRRHGQDSDNINGVIYLEGQKTKMIEDSDQEQHFRQRRYFYYLSGCAVPDCYLVHEIENRKTTLFIPPIDPEDVIWSGLPLSPDEALKRYDVDEVRPTTDINSFLVSLSSSSREKVWTIEKQVSDQVTFLNFDAKDFTQLKEAINECRVTKNSYEVALVRKANQISGLAHDAVLRSVAHASNERELEAIFIEKCIANGCRDQAYHSIVASGENAATLHYQKNNEPLHGRLNLLLDAGGEYHCYAADITRTFPINGTFTKESREIYDIVYRMQEECIKMVTEEVQWERVHEHAHKVAIEGLLKLGILSGDPGEIFDARTSVAFFPHGLGHYLGMDTHDTGGQPNYQDVDSMFKYLRVRGTLPAGSIVTVEPGIYFCRFIIEPYLQDPRHARYINQEVLDRYWTVGGVRIEDNVLVTENGYENLTTAVKDADEMERIIQESR